MESSPLLSCGEHRNKVGTILTGVLLSWTLQEKEHDCSEVSFNIFLSQYGQLAIFVAGILPSLFGCYCIFLPHSTVSPVVRQFIKDSYSTGN